MKVVADTNVLVSALVFGGKPQAILDLAHDGGVELFISNEILAETTRILRDKFHRIPAQLALDVMALEAVMVRVQPLEKIDAVPGDPTDNRILECAVAAGADVIVSGDAHLLRLGEFRGIKIQRPADFLTESRRR
ncbi:MAG: putative toxin-antitoxin system toxin component, PIN family [Acidobacteriota bacterium]